MPFRGPRPARWRARACAGAIAALAAACAPAAHATAVHTVAPDETLSSIAATDGLSTDALAAANGLSSDAELLSGTTLVIPSQDGTPDESESSGAAPSSGGSGGGSYVVVAGDTLSGIAAAEGLSTGELAAANGLGIDAPLIPGTALTLPGGSAGSSGGSSEGPAATADTVTGDQIAEQAASQNVGPNFAKAVAWQESGWDNSRVSAAGARGVMQITPDTWDFIQDNLADRTLDPTSPLDNVRAGATYLGYLFDQTGQDPASTLGGYYQGLGSLLDDGLLPDSRQYVDNVLSLRDSFAAGR